MATNPTKKGALTPDIQGGIVKRRVKEMISDKLASLIASGVLQVGDELPGERELAAALSVSRESVRGAIRELAARGLVEVSQGSRTRVCSIGGPTLKTELASPGVVNTYDLESVHQARFLVERSVVADAAERISAETICQLEASLVAQRECLDDPVRFLICDREFHFSIYRASSNPLLADFVMGLYTYMMEHRRVAVSQPGAILRSYKDHHDIVTALKTGDAGAVVAAFDRHIDRIYTTTRCIVDDIENEQQKTASKPLLGGRPTSALPPHARKNKSG